MIYNQMLLQTHLEMLTFVFILLILKWSKWGLTKNHFLRSMRMNKLKVKVMEYISGSLLLKACTAYVEYFTTYFISG